MLVWWKLFQQQWFLRWATAASVRNRYLLAISRSIKRVQWEQCDLYRNKYVFEIYSLETCIDKIVSSDRARKLDVFTVIHLWANWMVVTRWDWSGHKEACSWWNSMRWTVLCTLRWSRHGILSCSAREGTYRCSEMFRRWKWLSLPSSALWSLWIPWWRQPRINSLKERSRWSCRMKR